MLNHPTFDQLNAMGLYGMAKAFADLNANPDDAAGLDHAAWLAMLLEREAVHRHDKRLGARLRHARLPTRLRPKTSTIAPPAVSTGA